MGVIYLNRDQFGGNPEETANIVAPVETNVYPLYEGAGAFVFDNDGGKCKLSYYKDGKLWDSAVMTKKYQPS